MKSEDVRLLAAVRREFDFAKNPENVESLFARVIGLPGGALLPAGRLHQNHPWKTRFALADEWIEDQSRVAFFALDAAHLPTGVLGLSVNENLEVSLRVLSAPWAGVAGAAAGLARWAVDALCIERVVSAEAGELSEGGFSNGRYFPPQSTGVGQSLILTAGPSISMREGVYALDAAKHGWNNQWSKYLTRFEREFSSFVGVDHAMACSSCTGALTIALMALDIGPGDEVIVPDLTWVATANAVRYVGATPVFCDIELETWNMDPGSFESCITPRTRAVMPVHMYGNPARMDRIVEVARKHGLYIVEDAAPAIGAEWGGRRCGSFGDFAAFSFQGAKLLVTGEGGMLVTGNPALYEKALKIWDQGRNPNKVFWIDGRGVKYKMANVQAAVGLGQLERCDELVAMKRRVFGWYEEGLAGTPHVHLNREASGARGIYWMSSFRLDEAAPIEREDLRSELRKRNVDTRPVFPAISQYPIWEKQTPPQPTALRVGRQGINLPSGVCLRREEVAYVCEQLNALLHV